MSFHFTYCVITCTAYASLHWNGAFAVQGRQVSNHPFEEISPCSFVFYVEKIFFLLRSFAVNIKGLMLVIS